MKFKLKKDYYHRIKDELFLIPKGVELNPNKYDVYSYDVIDEDIIRTVHIRKALMENHPDIFERIQDKMTWQKLENKLGMCVSNAWDFMGLLHEYCILKDDYDSIAENYEKSIYAEVGIEKSQVKNIEIIIGYNGGTLKLINREKL